MTVTVSSSVCEWGKKFTAALRKHPYAAQSLEILEAEGVRRAVLLDFLYRYSTPDSVRQQRSLRKWAGETAKLLGKAEKLMINAADALESAIEDIQMGFPMALQSHGEAATVRSLRTAMEQTGKLRRHYKRISSQKGKARNEELLVYLCLLVEGITGRLHWEDLAYLLEAASFIHGESEEWDEDALRKIVGRFQKAHPEVYADLREFLVESRRGLPKPVPVKRSTRTRRRAEPNTTSPFIFLAKGRTPAKRSSGGSDKDD